MATVSIFSLKRHLGLDLRDFDDYRHHCKAQQEIIKKMIALIGNFDIKTFATINAKYIWQTLVYPTRDCFVVVKGKHIDSPLFGEPLPIQRFLDKFHIAVAKDKLDEFVTLWLEFLYYQSNILVFKHLKTYGVQMNKTGTARQSSH